MTDEEGAALAARITGTVADHLGLLSRTEVAVLRTHLDQVAPSDRRTTRHDGASR